MSFVANSFQNGLDASQRPRDTATGVSGTHEVLRYEDIRFKGALGPKEVELFADIPQETVYENQALVYVEESPLCYDTRVFEDKEEIEDDEQQNVAREEEGVKVGGTETLVVHKKDAGQDDTRDEGTLDGMKEEEETLARKASGDAASLPGSAMEDGKEGRDVSDGLKRKSAPSPGSEKEQVREKKRTKLRKSSSEEKKRAPSAQKTGGRPGTSTLKLPTNKKKFTHDELQLPSPDWKAYIVSRGKKDKNMVYHSPEGIICHSLEMVKGVESRRSKTLKFKGALHGLMRSVDTLKKNPNAMDGLDVTHVSRDAVVLYRIWRAQCHGEDNEHKA